MIESVPEQFGPFRIVRRFSRGGMGIVALSIDTRSNRAVILKRIAKEKRGTEGEVRFRDEIKLTAQFGHPSIVHVADFGEIDGEPYMALEHVVGQDLMSIIERGARGVGQMPPPVALKVIDRVLDALAYAHQVEGFVHRDISPGNVMVSYDGEVKLIDLGLALFDDKQSRTQAGIVAGTAGFIAPERARGQKATTRSDLWAVGTLAFSLMTGVPPAFVQPGDEAFTTWVERKKLSDAGKAWLYKAVSANPDDRFASAQEMRAALAEAEPLAGATDIAAYLGTAFAFAKTESYRELEELGVVSRRTAKTQPIPESTYVGLPSGALPKRVPMFALVTLSIAIAGSIAMITIKMFNTPTRAVVTDLAPVLSRTDLLAPTLSDLASTPLDAAPAEVSFDLAVAAKTTPKHPPSATPSVASAAMKAKIDAARSQMRAGQLTVAERMLGELAGPDGEPPPEAILALGDIALLKGNYDDAAMKGQSAWRKGKVKRGLYVAAIAYTKKGDLPSARKWLQKFLEVEPTDKAARELLDQIGTSE